MAGMATRLQAVDLRRGAPVGFLVGALAATLIFGMVQLANDPVLFFQTLMKSLGLGSVYALIALGFVLIFKATQTVNFAQGALAATGALFLAFLVQERSVFSRGPERGRTRRPHPLHQHQQPPRQSGRTALGALVVQCCGGPRVRSGGRTGGRTAGDPGP